jgi:hypothetical protein
MAAGAIQGGTHGRGRRGALAATRCGRSAGSNADHLDRARTAADGELLVVLLDTQLLTGGPEPADAVVQQVRRLPRCGAEPQKVLPLHHPTPTPPRCWPS